MNLSYAIKKYTIRSKLMTHIKNSCCILYLYRYTSGSMFCMIHSCNTTWFSTWFLFSTMYMRPTNGRIWQATWGPFPAHPALMATTVYTQWTVKWSVDFAYFECRHVAFSVYSYDPSKEFVMFLPKWDLWECAEEFMRFNNLLVLLQYTQNLYVFSFWKLNSKLST